MKRTAQIVIFLILLFGAFLAQAISAGSSLAYAFSDQELDNLLAPIALYPDPLLAVMLPASTYPAEIADADAWLKRGGTLSSIDGQGWDESVKAIAYYPDILNMMAGNLDWTANLGDVFLNRPEDVTRSVQRLRWQARNTGNLESNDKQQVIIAGDYIKIIPAQAGYMYVPQYDASVVYETRWVPGGPPFIIFGFGLAIGSWLSMDFDWRHRHVIYHGWNRPGWVNHARPYIHVPNVYINRSRPSINQTWRHDMSRGDPERFRTSQPGRISKGRVTQTPEARGRETAPTRLPGVIFGPRGDTNSFSNRGRQSLATVNQPQAPPAPGMSRRPSMPAPGISISSKPPPAGISMQPPKAPSVTFGGYRGDKEAKSQSLRGQSSRQSSMEKQPSAAPARRGSAPEVRSSPGGRPGR
jgi:hypothetical protein